MPANRVQDAYTRTLRVSWWFGHPDPWRTDLGLPGAKL